MAALSPVRRCLPGRAPLALAVALASLLTACGPATRGRTQTPAREEGTTAAPRTAGTTLIDAEGLDASFAAIPAGLDDALKASPGAAPAQVVALRQAAERAYHEEGAMLRDALAADPTIAADAANVIASLNALTNARNAAAAGPWTAEQANALDHALAASPDRQAITALSAAMAVSRFAGERALATRRMAWGLNAARRAGPQPSLSDASDQVAAIIAATRQAEDTRPSADQIVRDHGLIQALLKLPAADVSTLAAWYGRDAGKAARERLVGSFQGANDRAGRAMLIDFLTHPGTGG